MANVKCEIQAICTNPATTAAQRLVYVDGPVGHKQPRTVNASVPVGRVGICQLSRYAGIAIDTLGDGVACMTKQQHTQESKQLCLDFDPVVLCWPTISL